MFAWLYKKIMRNRRWQKAIPKPKSILLRIEVLEDRLAPAAFNFIAGGTTTNWSDPKNWQIVGNTVHTVPGVGDDVRLTGALASTEDIPNLTIQSLTLDAAYTSTLTLDNALIVDGGASTIAAGTIQGDDLTFQGGTAQNNSTVDWTGGLMAGGFKTTEIDQNVTLNISSDFVKSLYSRQLSIFGNVVWTGSGNIQLDQLSTVEVQQTGVFNANATNGQIVSLDVPSSFQLLDGTLVSNPSADALGLFDATLDVRFVNNGVVKVQSGTLHVADDSTTIGNGTPTSVNGRFNVLPGATLVFESSGDATLDGAVSFTRSLRLSGSPSSAWRGAGS
jgi:hypothetical protein